MKVGIVGLGRVGLPFAAISSKRFDTVGVDIDQELIQRVKQKAGFTEPGLDEYLRSYELRVSTEFSLLSDRDIVFFFVGSQTPGIGYSSKKLLGAIDMASPHLKEGQVVVISTTIPTGELTSVIFPKIENLSLVSKLRGWGYNPAMIALGNVIENFEKPNYVLVGESNEDVGDVLADFWKSIAWRDVPIFRSSIANIALAKYALNMALVTKISLMSFVTELSEKLGGNIDDLSRIFKAEPRIAGPGMFRGGLGYGGTCFPVDVEAMRYECQRLGVPTAFLDAVTSLNDWQVTRSVLLAKSFQKKRVAILGLTYKPNTAVVDASQGLEIARRLAADGLEITVYDPEGVQAAKNVLGSSVSYASGAKEAIQNADVVFIAVDWREFKLLAATDFHSNQIIIDPWRILQGLKLPSRYYGFGIGAPV